MKVLSPLLRRSRAGFVLLEALATLAIGALVIAGAASVITLLLRTADRTAMVTETLEVTERAVAAIERDLRLAVRIPIIVDGVPALVFFGSPRKLVFPIDRMQPSGFMAPVLVRWESVTGSNGRGRLVRTEAPMLPHTLPPDKDFGKKQEADTGPADIRFAFFGPQPDGKPGEVLTDEWVNVQALPAAIRIGRANPGSDKVISSVRISFPTDAENGCLDAKGGYCSLVPGRPPAVPSPEADSNKPREAEKPPRVRERGRS